MTTSDAVLSTNIEATLRAPRALRYAPVVARFVLGGLFFVCGLNGFLNFLPPPADPQPAGAMAFGGALMQTGYMFQLIGGSEALVGALLLANRFVPLALTILAPVVINIFAFHLFLARAGMGMAVLVLLLEVYLAWCYRAAFRPMLMPRAKAS